VSQARLYITAHGVYAAEMNGQTVGDHILAPGWTSYDHRLIYQTFDVGHLLRKRDNVLGAHVGAGWLCGRLGFLGGKRNIWGDNIGLLAELIINFDDGRRETVVTDGDWKWHKSPIWFSEIYDGEGYDARLDSTAWSSTHFSDLEWQSVKAKAFPGKQRLQCSDSPPVRRTQELQAQRVFKSPSNRTIVDFGQNIVGWLRVKVAGPKGHKISFTHTEVLEDGEVATRPLREAKAKDALILSGGSLCCGSQNLPSTVSAMSKSTTGPRWT
jgi:alpha-L-rhamnosidase